MSDSPEYRNSPVHTEVRTEPPDPSGPRESAAGAWMYGAALAAGVLLIIAGHTTAVAASGYVTPFLVVFERRRL